MACIMYSTTLRAGCVSDGCQKWAIRASDADGFSSLAYDMPMQPTPTRRMLIEAVIASTIGTTIEWYTFHNARR